MKATNQCTFSSLKNGDTFFQNGNTYVKKSSRTAHLIEYDRRFYFAQREWVTVREPVARRVLAESRA